MPLSSVPALLQDSARNPSGELSGTSLLPNLDILKLGGCKASYRAREQHVALLRKDNSEE